MGSRNQLQEGGMHHQTVKLTSSVGKEGPYQVDLPLDPATLNERLFGIGLWLVEHDIPHQARVMLQPDYGRVRVSFLNADDAKAFHERFSPRLH